MKKTFIFFKLTALLFFCSITSFAQNSNFTATYTSTYLDDTAPFGQVNAGDKIQYAIKIENNTSSEITNITLTNPAFYNAVLTGTTIANLSAGSFDDTTFSLLQTISAEDMTKGVAYYNAELSGTINGNNFSGIIIDGVSNSFLNNTWSCLTIATNLNITSYSATETPEIIDDTAPIGTLNAGDKVKFNYTFTNTGQVDLLINNSTYSYYPNLSVLAGQSNTTFSETRAISHSEFNSGYIYNKFNSFGEAPSINCFSDSITNLYISNPTISTVPCINCPIDPNGGTVFSLGRNLQLKLTGEYQDTTAPFGKANVGDVIVYTYTIKNIGNETLTNVHITDALYPVTGNPITSLAPNEINTTNFTSTHIIESNDILVNGGWAVNSAIVRGTLPTNVEVIAKSYNPDYSLNYYLQGLPNCETCTLTRFDVYPNMIINYEDTFEDLTAPFGIANAGDKVNYNITVQNTGNVNFNDVVLYKNYSSALSNSISSLLVGATDNTTFSDSHTLTNFDIQNGFVANKLYSYGNFPSIVLYSDEFSYYNFSSTDPTPCSIDCPPSINIPSNSTITKLNTLTLELRSYIEDTIAPFGTINVGEEITYTYKIKNKTGSEITNLTLSDPNATITGIVSSLANNEDTISFIGKHIVTQADIDTGYVLNSAQLNCSLNGENVTINSTTTNPYAQNYLPSGTNCNNCTITFLGYDYSLDFIVEDNLTSLSNVQIGDEIQYNINLVNNGNSFSQDLYNLEISSSNATVFGTLNYLAAGDSNNTSFTATHIITADDLTNGYVYNNFIVHGNPLGSDSYSAAISYFIKKSHDATPCTTCVQDPNCNNCNITALNNNIKLNAFVDSNANGVKDSGESDFPLGKFYYNINDNALINEITTTNGIHFLHGGNPTNTYDIGFSVLPEYAFNYSASTTYSNITIGDSVVTYYFPVTVLPYNDTEINVLPIGAPPRPGFTYMNVISYTNNGNQTVTNGTVTFTKNNVSSLISVSESGATITPTGFTFDFTNLLPFETRTITVTMQNPTLPTVDFGQVLTNVATISIPTNDINVNNNTSSLSQSIVGSFDPNDKAESHNGTIDHDTFTANDYLTYTIRFENTGNYPAEFVTVIDELESKLDETSVKMVAASHPYTLTRQNNKLTWLFDNIQLQPSIPNSTVGHGFLVFKIKPKVGYEIGDIISNIANIYFDYNPPIITNICSTEFVPPLNNPSFDSHRISLYPNPVKDNFTISSKETIDSVEIYSVLGQLMMSKTINEANAQINVSKFNKGVYFVKINSDNKTKSYKIIKE